MNCLPLCRHCPHSDCPSKGTQARARVVRPFLSRLNFYLAARSPACSAARPARCAARLENALEILRLYYDFIRPHSSVRFGQVTRTPAMQAVLFDRPLTFRESFSWVPPPPVVLPRHVEYR